MKIVVFGASSGIGREVSLQAVAAGHEVVGVARSAATAPPAEGVQLIAGDATNPTVTAEITADADVIVSAIGIPNPKQPIDLFTKAAKSLVAAAERIPTKRLVVVSAGGGANEPHDTFFTKTIIKPMLRHFLRYLYEDQGRMEKIIEASDTNWTIMRPARLTTGKYSGKYRTAHNDAVPGGLSIARADVADYIVQHLGDSNDYKQHVSIAY